MRRIVTAFLVSLTYFVPEPADCCTFDPSAVAKELATTAARNPGAIFVSGEHAFKWHLASGEVVSISRSGCEDLGVTVSVAFAEGHVPSNEQAATHLFKAVSQYWSPRQAQDAMAAWQKQRRTLDVGAEYRVSETALFPFGFTLTHSKNRISLSWVEA